MGNAVHKRISNTYLIPAPLPESYHNGVAGAGQESQNQERSLRHSYGCAFCDPSDAIGSST